jgi:hypothetical protein
VLVGSKFSCISNSQIRSHLLASSLSTRFSVYLGLFVITFVFMSKAFYRRTVLYEAYTKKERKNRHFCVYCLL